MSVAARLVLFVPLLALVACAAPIASPTPTLTPEPSSTPSHRPTSAPTRTPTLTPTPAESPRPRIQRLVDQPILRASDLGDYGAILPAAYFMDGDVRHAYLIGFGDLPGIQRVFHASSPDGIDWAIDAADPFADLGLDLNPPGPIPGSVFELGDGSWVMYLWGVAAPATRGEIVWRATSGTPSGPWVADSEPILPLGDTGTWDSLALDFPSVIATDDGYSMLYSAVSSLDVESSAIGLATSPDGVSWTKLPEPVIRAGTCASESAHIAAMPRVFSEGDGYLILFDIGRQTAGARSHDLQSWTCMADEPLLTAADVPGSQGIHTFAAAAEPDGDISILIESLITGGSEVWLGELVVGE